MELLHSLIFMLGEMAPYILLGFLIAGLMHAFVPQRTMARHLSGSGWRPVVKAALLGIPLPLCSCGVLPTAIAMRRGGASKAASTSFLIATPQTGVDSIAATWSLLGPAFAVIRPVAALVTSFFGGMAVGATERTDVACAGGCDDGPDMAHGGKKFIHKLRDALRYGFVDLVGSIGGWLVAGLAIAALITVYVPDGFFTTLGDIPVVSMLVVLLVAIPMYVCATGSIPIAMSLMLKGLSPGTALVLLMAGPAANFASAALISKEMGRKAATVYIASIVAGAILFGLAIDYILPRDWFAVITPVHGACHAVGEMGLFTLTCSVVLVALLIISFIKNRKHNHINITEMTKTYNVKGMNCPHCQASVAKSISSVSGVTAVDVNLSTGVATVDGVHDSQAVIDAVRAAGFDIA